ncbi:MAG: helix-turn-helix transcriptional regulator [Bauldia sp.]
MLPEVDSLLLQLFEITQSADWEAWLASLRNVFGATVATLAPLGIAAASLMTSTARSGVVHEQVASYRDASPSHDLALADDAFLRGERNGDLTPAGRRYGLGVTIDAGAARYVLNLGRDEDRGDFGPEHASALTRVAGFLKRAMASQRLFRSAIAEAEASRALMNASHRGIVFLDATLRIAFANRAAEDLLAAEDVVGLRGGVFGACNRSQERRFRDLLETAANDPGRSSIVMLTGTRSDRHVTAEVTGLSSKATPFDAAGGPPVVMIVLTSPAEQTVVDPDCLEEVFGFTGQEARVASLLVAGLELSEVADRLSISRETVRHHLKGLFAKTGRHSQRDLVHMITMSLPASALVPGQV